MGLGRWTTGQIADTEECVDLELSAGSKLRVGEVPVPRWNKDTNSKRRAVRDPFHNSLRKVLVTRLVVSS